MLVGRAKVPDGNQSLAKRRAMMKSGRTSSARQYDRLPGLLEKFDPVHHGGEAMADEAVGVEVLGRNPQS